LVIRVGAVHGNTACYAERVSSDGALDIRATEKDLEELDIGKRRDSSGLVHSQSEFGIVITLGTCVRKLIIQKGGGDVPNASTME